MVIRPALRSVAISLAVLLASLFAGSAAHAQDGQIGGTVRAPSGTAVGSARVIVTSAASGVTRTALTSAEGKYNVTGLSMERIP